MALPKLTATDEMKQIATSDLPRKEKTDYGYVREVCEYYTYLRCIKQDGILKVAFFFPEHLRLDGSNPAYEVYLDKEKRQFITYNSLIQKWSESKLDRLDWKRQYWYTKAYWIEQATEFLQKWQRVITARLTESDKALAAESRILREKEFIQLKKDRVIIHTGHLAGRLLADVLMADLMENTDSIQSPVLAAAA